MTCRAMTHLALRLLLLVALGLSGVTPSFVVVTAGADGAEVAWTLPDGTAVPICHALPGGTGEDGQNQAIHCGKCVVVGHALVLAAPAAGDAAEAVITAVIDWPLPVRTGAANASIRATPARGPPSQV